MKHNIKISIRNTFINRIEKYKLKEKYLRNVEPSSICISGDPDISAIGSAKYQMKLQMK